jgi:hypothetical protein
MTPTGDMHWLNPALAGVAGPAGVTCRRARLKSRLKAERIYLPKDPAGAAIRAPSALDVPADWLEAVWPLVMSVSLGECWEPPPEVIQDITKIFNKILRGAP